jgi:hypothetical protein
MSNSNSRGNGNSRKNDYLDLKIQTNSESVADDGYIDLKSGVAGWGFVMAGDNEEYGFFSFTSAGVVSLLTSTNSANFVATDTDAKLCVFDNGTNVRIRNRLGSAKTLRVEVKYS